MENYSLRAWICEITFKSEHPDAKRVHITTNVIFRENRKNSPEIFVREPSVNRPLVSAAALEAFLRAHPGADDLQIAQANLSALNENGQVRETGSRLDLSSMSSQKDLYKKMHS